MLLKVFPKKSGSKSLNSPSPSVLFFAQRWQMFTWNPQLRGFLIWFSLFKSDLHTLKGEQIFLGKTPSSLSSCSSLPNTTRHSVPFPKTSCICFICFISIPRKYLHQPIGVKSSQIVERFFVLWKQRRFGVFRYLVGNPYQTWIYWGKETKRLYQGTLPKALLYNTTSLAEQPILAGQRILPPNTHVETRSRRWVTCFLGFVFWEEPGRWERWDLSCCKVQVLVE